MEIAYRRSVQAWAENCFIDLCATNEPRAPNGSPVNSEQSAGGRLIRCAGLISRLAVTSFFAACIALPGSLAKQFNEGLAAYRFDAGPRGSIVEPGDYTMRLDSVYTAKSGYGWTRRPTSEFIRQELALSRNQFTIDGVTGRQIAMRVNVAPGDWIVTVWLESVRLDTTNLQVLLQGQLLKPGWQEFTPPAEPGKSLPKPYRVIHASTQVGAEGLALEFVGSDHDVRLLGISLIRKPVGAKPLHQEFMTRLRIAGRHDSTFSLRELSEDAEKERLKDPTEPLFVLWRERLELLIEAERLFNMRGWEWAKEKTGLGMFERLYQAVMLMDGLLAADATREQPLADRATYLRGRILYWLNREGAGELERAGAKRDLATLYARHPQDKVLAMYTGQKIDQPDACDCLPISANVPAWSALQREALCRMRQIAHWWVLERQADNGEFGGKLGDDVELLRWWAPLVLSGDRNALKGWEKLANGVWHSKEVHDGYAAEVSDVEHAAEFVADTAPMMAIYSDDPLYLQRLNVSTKHFKNLWTGVTPQGRRFFRSAWFSSSAIEAEEPKGRDLEYNTRAVQPMRYYAWRTDNPEAVALLHQWSLSWVHAAMRTDKGKPLGIIPPSIRFPDEAINGDEPTWFLPNMMWSYFDWEHNAGSLMLDQLLFTYSLTKDDRLLKPLRFALDLVRTEKAALAEENHLSTPGSPAWAVAKLAQRELFWQVVEQWRFMTNDSRWDDLIRHYGTPYGKYRLSGEERHLIDGMNQLLEGVRYNIPLMTTEAIHTDRVYVPRAELLKAMLTGDGVKDNVSPYYAVSWEGTDEDFTALVTDTGDDRLSLRVYSHSPKECEVKMRIWQLLPGDYCFRQEYPTLGKEPGSITKQSLKILQKGQRVALVIPPQREVTISIARKRELPAR